MTAPKDLIDEIMQLAPASVGRYWGVNNYGPDLKTYESIRQKLNSSGPVFASGSSYLHIYTSTSGGFGVFGGGRLTRSHGGIITPSESDRTILTPGEYYPVLPTRMSVAVNGSGRKVTFVRQIDVSPESKGILACGDAGASKEKNEKISSAVAVEEIPSMDPISGSELYPILINRSEVSFSAPHWQGLPIIVIDREGFILRRAS
ncbi:MAG: hypothetical protein R3C60_02085 [Parvularculaceae bacterium]